MTLSPVYKCRYCGYVWIGKPVRSMDGKVMHFGPNSEWCDFEVEYAQCGLDEWDEALQRMGPDRWAFCPTNCSFLNVEQVRGIGEVIAYERGEDV